MSRAFHSDDIDWKALYRAYRQLKFALVERMEAEGCRLEGLGTKYPMAMLLTHVTKNLFLAVVSATIDRRTADALSDVIHDTVARCHPEILCCDFPEDVTDDRHDSL